MTYREMRESHQKRYNESGMFFAFSEHQFVQEMVKRGLHPINDTDKIMRVAFGGYILKQDEDNFEKIVDQCHHEMWENISEDKTGLGFILDMFREELANHEFSVTYDASDALCSLGITSLDLKRSYPLRHGLGVAMAEIFAA